MGRVKTVLRACFAALLTLAGLPLQGAMVRADPIADFYNGRVVSLIIASGEGGYDAYGRLFARHLHKHIPGNPKVIPQQMPGAGGLQGINHIYNVAPRDGSVIGLVRRSAIIAHITQPSAARFDISKINWLGNIVPELPVAVAWHTSRVKTFDDLRRTEHIVGGTGASSVHETTPRLLNALLGTKFRIVGGYKGSGDLDLAMERGEIEGMGYDSWSNVKVRKGDMLSRGLVFTPLSFGLDRNPDLPNTPFALDFVRNEEDKQLMQAFFAQDAAARPMIAPPGIPVDRLDALRVAFISVEKDSEFLSDAEKSLLTLGLGNHLYMKKIVDMVAATPPALAQRLNEITAP